eukprot:10899263-Lingulodinium_polyedra.AAC.1
MSTAMAIPVPRAGAVKNAAKSTILRTAAAWLPHASCPDCPDLVAVIAAITRSVDRLLDSRPFLATLSYSLDLPAHKYRTSDLPES